MSRFFLLILLLVTTPAGAQRSLTALVEAEYRAGHFNGTLLAVKDGRVVAQVSKGYANFQFSVPVTADTRFPIASMTKLFTAVLTLQLVDQAVLKLEDKAAAYVPDLPPACHSITIADLLTHRSGLRNEPSTQVYQARYSTAEFVRKFVAKDEGKAPAFNYNNIDYILLTRILEVVSGQTYGQLLRQRILAPLQMQNSGLVQEARITPHLAYGYHNYTFGAGSSRDTLRNDAPKYLSNYAGAGAMYSTAADLYKLVRALQTRALLSATASSLLLKPQPTGYVEQARGYPTLGFYYNDRTFPKPVVERRGSIDGFNSVLLTDPDFTRVIIILNNTDTGDLEKLGDLAYKALDYLAPTSSPPTK
ncbi:class A beta-lactamase-related serine hydrolase [Hymenobacter aquaticus]|uniref:Class A beta-lactamase-related serine hydrolase n=1 Tax=Hymenobacter aquaticus TaxID=1867101 RepID=A0A4Z0Q292_9BACT|nr:serine hydrolase domain-containing protein [Hymenobacter aquaticus]TGE23805.1 class A beta-lactamase-related serine hydrolase [Hymenobacter aquaticus]